MQHSELSAAPQNLQINSVIHDLLNPITMVQVNLDYLSLELDNCSQEKIRRMIENAKCGIDQVGRIVISLKLAQQKQEHFLVSSELTQICNIFSAKIMLEKIELALKFGADRDFIRERLLFDRIFVNLVTNAIEALQTTKRFRKTLEISTYEDKKFFYVEIADNGPGIRPQQLPKIFNQGYSTKAEGQRGLGLYFVKSTLKDAFAAEIFCRSIVGIGTKFLVRFPLAQIC